MSQAKTEFSQADSSASQVFSYPVMRPSREEIRSWNQQFSAEPVFSAKTEGVKAQDTGSSSLLEYLGYIPSERDQGECGNCWVWASTGAIEIAHTLQNNVQDRLSVQYVNSRYNNGGLAPYTSEDFACNGGTPSIFSSFYTLMGAYGGNKIAIPWSNNNSAFRDGNATTNTLVPASTIQTTPHYAIRDMSVERIETTGVSQEEAIFNIKAVIDSGNAVYLAFYYPDIDSWREFYEFWDTGSEDDSFIRLDKYAGTEYSSTGGAHAVLITGYIDDGTTGYWQCLNSWGAPLNRPNGLFYADMYMDYNAVYPYGTDTVPVVGCEKVSVGYVGAEPTPDPNGTSYNLTADFSASPQTGYPPLTVHFSDKTNETPSSWKWNFGDGGGSAIRNPNHTYSQPGKYTVTLTAYKGSQSAIITKEDIVTVKYPYINITAFPLPETGNYPLPTDPDGDGRFEDINGNGWLEFNDPKVLLENLEFAMKNEPVLQFDFDNSGFIGYDDVVALQKMV